jgi:AraC-like DNA-binding protein
MKYFITQTPKPVTGDLPERDTILTDFTTATATDTPAVNALKTPLCSTGERIAILPRQVVNKALETPTLNGLLAATAGISPNVTNALGQPPTANTETLLIYCSRGRGWCEMGGRRYGLSPGQLLVIPAGTPHVYGADRECLWAISWVQAAGVNLPFFLHQLGVTADQPVIEVGTDASIPALFHELLDAIEAGGSTTQLAHAALMLTRLFELFRNQPCNQACSEADAAQKIRQSIAYMSEHLDQPLQVAALAAKANISQSHYFALFKRHIGSTPIDYFTQLRMQRACHLLGATTMSVKGVAAALGYDDPFYFSRVFRSVQGVAPSDYRLAQSRFKPSVSGVVRQTSVAERILHVKRRIIHSMPEFHLR